MLGVWVEFRTLFGRQPGVLLLMFFSGLKLLESRTHRDGAIAAFLGYFLIITNFLYTQSIPTALAMCLGVFAITATLVGFSAPARPVAANLRTAGLLLGHAAPAAILLFVLFPRVQGPLWGLPQDAYSGMTGLSETMTPGALSQLALSDAIAFRASFEGDRRRCRSATGAARCCGTSTAAPGAPASGTRCISRRPSGRAAPTAIRLARAAQPRLAVRARAGGGRAAGRAHEL